VFRCFLIVCASSILLVATATAQRVPLAWAPLSNLSSSPLYDLPLGGPLTPGSLLAEQADSVARQIQPTHWKEGGLVGALAVGAFGAWLGSEICRNSDTGSGCTGVALGGALGGGVLGFLIGALIGGQFPKQPSAPAEPT
jgi:hypothetical protein